MFFNKIRSLKCLFNSIIFKSNFINGKNNEEKQKKQREEDKKKQDEEKEDWDERNGKTKTM